MSEFSPEAFFCLKDWPYASLFEDLVFVWDALFSLESYLMKQPLGNIACPIPHSTHLVNPRWISIGEGSVIEPGCFIQGPCIIGPHSQIRHGAYIRGNVLLGSRCIIGHATEVKHAIFFDGAKAPHFNYVGDSILGNDVNLGAGVICANFRLDHKSITVRSPEVRVDTRLEKMGAVIGDGSQIGCNAVLSPGTLVGKKTQCHPCLHIGGWIPAFSCITSSRSSHQRSHQKTFRESF